MSLLLHHGADSRLANNVQQRPVDVASTDEVIQLLCQHTHIKHLSDDVTADRHAVTSPDDVTAKRANCERQADVDLSCGHQEPLDLSIPKGADTQSRNFSF